MMLGITLLRGWEEILEILAGLNHHEIDFLLFAAIHEAMATLVCSANAVEHKFLHGSVFHKRIVPSSDPVAYDFPSG
jgi:hypothetical protein